MTSGDAPGSSKRKRSRAKNGVCFECERDGEMRRIRLAQDVDLPLEEFAAVREPDGYAYTDALPESQLPGAGERYADCGDDLTALFCRECATPHTTGRTCRRFSCPRCHEAGEFQQARRMASKLESFRRHADAQSEDGVYLHHLSVSFQEGTRFNSIDPLERAIEAIELLLQRVNVDTGYLLFHPYKPRFQYQARSASLSPGFDGGWPDTRTMIEREDWTTVREARLVHDPHFHVFGVSDFVQTEAHTEDLERETGVVIHRITRSWPTGKSYSIADVEDLCRIMLNELTHVGVTSTGDDATKAMLRPFGEVANFPADDRTSAVVTATLRDVTQSILGVDFSERRCTKPVENGAQSYTGTTTECTDGSCRMGQQSATSSEDSQRREVCGGKLISMHAASAYLDDPDVVARVKAQYGEQGLSALRAAAAEWADLDGIHEDEPPG